MFFQNRVEYDRYNPDLADVSCQSKVMMKKTAENYRNFYVAEKHIVSKLSQISIPNFNSTMTSIKIVSKFHVPIF